MVSNNPSGLKLAYFFLWVGMVQKNQNKVILKKVSSFLNSILEKHGLVLLDISFRKEDSERILRVTVDKIDVNIDDCTLISSELSAWLDEVNIITYDDYSLEVSTPGLERSLVSVDDYKRFLNSFCNITLKKKESDGRKKFSGIIQSVSDDKIMIFVDKESKTFEIDFCNIKKANLEVVF